LKWDEHRTLKKIIWEMHRLSKAKPFDRKLESHVKNCRFVRETKERKGCSCSVWERDSVSSRSRCKMPASTSKQRFTQGFRLTSPRVKLITFRKKIGWIHTGT